MLNGATARRGGAIRGVFIALALILPFAGEAYAASPLCRDLEARLASTQSDNGKATSYGRAILKQQDELAAARAQSRGLGCGFAIFPGRAAQCGNLAATIDRMESNLLTLRQTEARLGGARDNRRERARILAKIEVNNCRGRPERTQQASVENGIITIEPTAGQDVPSGGRYRTMCVRSCDGYYFPIGNASPPQQFQQDEERCESLCPGADVELYYQTRATEAGEMTSVSSGAAYAQQSFAFRFRDTDYRRPESCGCNAPKNYTILGGEKREPQSEPMVEASLPKPSPRPDPALDPESYADQLGGLDSAAIDRLLPTKSDTPAPAGEEADRPVRVVGPMFLPDPEGAIDLRAPARPDDP